MASMIFILSESHIALHSWPNKGYLHIDIVTCTKGGLKLKSLQKFVENHFPKETNGEILELIY